MVGIRKTARANLPGTKVRGDSRRPHAGQWLRFWPNPEVHLDSAGKNYNSQKPQRHGPQRVEFQHLRGGERGAGAGRDLGVRLGYRLGLRLCVSEFLQDAGTQSGPGGPKPRHRCVGSGCLGKG